MTVVFNTKANRWQDSVTGKFTKNPNEAKMEKFEDLFKTISFSIMMQTGYLRSLSSTTDAALVEHEKQTSLLSKLVDLKQSELDSTQETRERERTEDQLYDTDDKPVAPDDEAAKPFFDDIMDGLSLKTFLTGAAIAPFVFNFAKGFLEEITDGLIQLTPEGTLAALRAPKVVGMISTLTTSLLGLDKLADVVGPLGGIFGKISTAADALKTGRLAATFSFFGNLSGVGAFTKLFTRIAWPLSVIMGLYDGVIAWQKTEGNFIEKTLSGIGGFLGEILGAPLDLIKQAASWVAEKLGFEAASKWLDEISIEDSIKNLFGGIYGFVADAVDDIVGMFTWVKDGITSFSLMDTVNGAVDNIIIWAEEIFDFLPSVDDIKERLLSLLPDWMQPSTEVEQLENEIANLNERKEALETAEPAKRPSEAAAREATLAEINEKLVAAKVELETAKVVAAETITPNVIQNVIDSVAPVTVKENKAILDYTMGQAETKLESKVDAISEQEALEAATRLFISNGGNSIRGGDTNRGGDVNTINISPGMPASSALNAFAK